MCLTSIQQYFKRYCHKHRDQFIPSDESAKRRYHFLYWSTTLFYISLLSVPSVIRALAVSDIKATNSSRPKPGWTLHSVSILLRCCVPSTKNKRENKNHLDWLDSIELFGRRLYLQPLFPLCIPRPLPSSKLFFCYLHYFSIEHLTSSNNLLFLSHRNVNIVPCASIDQINLSIAEILLTPSNSKEYVALSHQISLLTL